MYTMLYLAVSISSCHTFSHTHTLSQTLANPNCLSNFQFTAPPLKCKENEWNWTHRQSSKKWENERGRERKGLKEELGQRQLCSAVGGVWPRLTASLLSSIVSLCVCVYLHMWMCAILACLFVITVPNCYPCSWLVRDEEKNYWFTNKQEQDCSSSFASSLETLEVARVLSLLYI